MDEAKKLVVLEQENEELKRELKELFKTLDTVAGDTSATLATSRMVTLSLFILFLSAKWKSFSMCIFILAYR